MLREDATQAPPARFWLILSYKMHSFLRMLRRSESFLALRKLQSVARPLALRKNAPLALNVQNRHCDITNRCLHLSAAHSPLLQREPAWPAGGSAGAAASWGLSPRLAGRGHQRDPCRPEAAPEPLPAPSAGPATASHPRVSHTLHHLSRH